jgi:hypothetical protein
MQSWMEAAIIVETTLICFLLALWLAAMALRGLFHMMPGVRSQVLPISPATAKTHLRPHPSQAGDKHMGSRVQQA